MHVEIENECCPEIEKANPSGAKGQKITLVGTKGNTVLRRIIYGECSAERLQQEKDDLQHRLEQLT